jgi:predicted lipoprotein with Yx(FWY)xxD motif
MRGVKRLSTLLVTGLMTLAGCGGDEESGGSGQQDSKNEAAVKKDDAAVKNGARAMASGTTITLGDSECGEMLFSSSKQAIYIFENDPKGETVCYGECAEAWPPVLTTGKPKAARGVKAALLGTVKRRDGKLQVTYAGRPLYFYSHEGPGEVRCHNVDLNGGFWWVVGPDGNRRA